MTVRDYVNCDLDVESLTQFCRLFAFLQKLNVSDWRMYLEWAGFDAYWVNEEDYEERYE